MTIVSDRIEHEIHIKAPPETVFAYFTDPERHPRWMGVEATLDPRPGGVYRCVVHDKATVLGEYVIVEPPHRVVLRLVHTGLPHPALGPHGQGWTNYLNNLSAA